VLESNNGKRKIEAQHDEDMVDGIGTLPRAKRWSHADM
jgi:hypothetical protein